jgi:hypothetical protein
MLTRVTHQVVPDPVVPDARVVVDHTLGLPPVSLTGFSECEATTQGSVGPLSALRVADDGKVGA